MTQKNHSMVILIMIDWLWFEFPIARHCMLLHITVGLTWFESSSSREPTRGTRTGGFKLLWWCFWMFQEGSEQARRGSKLGVLALAPWQEVGKSKLGVLAQVSERCTGCISQTCLCQLMDIRSLRMLKGNASQIATISQQCKFSELVRLLWTSSWNSSTDWK